MNDNKPILFESFAKKAAAKLQERKKMKTKKLYIGDLDETIEIRALTDQEFQDCSEYSDNGIVVDKYTIFYASKTLQDLAATMVEQGVIKKHLEIMDMFTPADRSALAKEVMKLSGIMDNTTVKELDEVKN